MKSNHTPIGRIPQCGYKECKFGVAHKYHSNSSSTRLQLNNQNLLFAVDLHSFYTKVQKVGGYDAVMANRMWKSIFDELSGNHNSTSAATVIRRHYER